MFVGCFVPNWLMQTDIVTQGAKLTYGRLCQYAGSNGKCFPMKVTLAKDLAVSKTTAWGYIEELKNHKLIVEKDGFFVFLYNDLMDSESSAERTQSSAGRTEVRPSELPIVLRESIRESFNSPEITASLETDFPKPRINKHKKVVNQYSDGFESWWKLYPARNGIKVGKPDAFKKFLKISDIPGLIEATKAYAASKEVKEGYAKDAVRFLKDGVWEAWRGQRIDSKAIVDPFDRYRNQKPEDLA